MLTSLSINNKDHIDLFLLHSELDENDFEKIRDSLSTYDIEIIPLKIDNSMLPPEAPTTEQWSLEIYYRLFLTEILPDSVDRILYLDCDIIINKDLSEFYNTDFDDNHLTACKDANGNRNKFSETETLMFSDIYSDSTDYFNSGVLLMNIAKMRKDGIKFSTYFEVMKKYAFDLAMPDQDLLNFAHAGKIKYIDFKKYNLFAITAERVGISYDYALENTKIFHFAEGKPWNISDHIHSRYENLWWNYAKKTNVYDKLFSIYENSFDDEMQSFEKDIFNHELLFLKYVNTYVYLSKGISEDRLNTLAEKYNKNGMVLKVLDEFDLHHNEKNHENCFSPSKKLSILSDKFHALSGNEKIHFINEDIDFNSFLEENRLWLYRLSTATQALMYTVQELV